MGEHSIYDIKRISYIKEFTPEIVYIKGQDNLMADYLPRPQKKVNNLKKYILPVPRLLQEAKL